jgi:hypothetical protein
VAGCDALNPQKFTLQNHSSINMEDRKSRLLLNPSVAQISTGAAAGVAALAASSTSVFAQVGEVPVDVQTGIDNAQATVVALNPLALAALSVALVPMGAMLTLRFLNMVLSRV